MECTVDFEKEKVSSEIKKKKKNGGQSKHSECGGISEPWKAVTQ